MISTQVGFHVRRTDNALSIARSPIGGFLRALDRLAAAGDAGRGAVRVARGAARAAKRGGAVDVYVASDAEAPPALTRGTSFSHKRGR